jgi:hypothetical protein
MRHTGKIENSKDNSPVPVLISGLQTGEIVAWDVTPAYRKSQQMI